jgi:hypothetical protein
MPRTGSRAQLVHMLADGYAAALREVYGEPRAYPRDFYDDFQRLSTAELKELAAGLKPNPRGRPRSAVRRSRHSSLLAQVEAVLTSGKRRSVRGACQYVGAKAGVPAETLRKLRRVRI